jgi:hypothetical protein
MYLVTAYLILGVLWTVWLTTANEMWKQLWEALHVTFLIILSVALWPVWMIVAIYKHFKNEY